MVRNEDKMTKTNSMTTSSTQAIMTVRRTLMSKTRPEYHECVQEPISTITSTIGGIFNIVRVSIVDNHVGSQTQQAHIEKASNDSSSHNHVKVSVAFAGKKSVR